MVVQLAGETEPAILRIEAVRNPATGLGQTWASRQVILTTPPTHPPKNGTMIRKPEFSERWVPYDLPWTNAHTPEGAIRQALGLLSLRCKESGKVPRLNLSPEQAASKGPGTPGFPGQRFPLLQPPL